MLRNRFSTPRWGFVAACVAVSACTNAEPESSSQTSQLGLASAASEMTDSAIMANKMAAMKRMDEMAAHSDSEAAARADSIAPVPHPGPISRALDADQRFLRQMLNHHETLLVLVHEQMMSPRGHASHGSDADPAELDSQLDAERARMLALLKELYGEQYSPQSQHALPATGKEDRETRYKRLLAAFREGPRIIERAKPALRRRQVIQLASELRVSQIKQIHAVQSTETPKD